MDRRRGISQLDPPRLDRVPNLLAPGSELAREPDYVLLGPKPTIVTSGSSSTSSQTQSFSATSSSTSEPVRHGARKGNLVADFAAKPGPAASKVSIPRFQGERRQCGGDLGAAADRGRVHF